MKKYYSYKLKICYKGTGYYGWQKQAKSNLPTIQGELEKALNKISKSDDVKTLGAGRTDAGVHALGQVVRVIMPLKIQENGLREGLNSILDKRISVLDVVRFEGKFNPISDAISKEYIYLFSTKRKLSPFAQDYIGAGGFELNMDLLNSAASLFVGEKNFENYMCTGTPVLSTIRKIEYCAVESHAILYPFNFITDQCYVLRINGNGFLKQMVRLIMGTLWMVGREKIDLAQIEQSFEKKLNYKLGPVVPANGLYLDHVKYKNNSSC